MQYTLKRITQFVIIFFALWGGMAVSDEPRLQRDGPIARDYINKLEWMRCSVGQHWENDTCVGEVLMLSVAEAQEIIERVDNLDGGGWRLPTVKELQTIVSKVETRPDDIEPNIDQKTFPNTFAGPYWSVEQSFYSKRYQWSVNFFNGQRYNRFFPTQKIAVRLVRNYKIK